MERVPHTIVETESFLDSITKVWTETEREVFKQHIGLNVLDGDLIPGTGGLRKIRWTRAGKGKRGGVRVIYYYYHESAPLYLLFAYPKSAKDNLTSEETDLLREVAEQIKKTTASIKGRAKQ